ncbi:MAG: hypothetical protein NTV73_02490 [Hyphomicrobiales bacterium]|nr:hypothetical protein [Hyphomicrobiales bacterium]
MRTISALFDTYDEVVAAVDQLADMGIDSREITVVTRGPPATSKIAEGAGLGAAIGGVGGVLAGLGAVALPGPGLLLGIGWLAPLLLAAAGGVAGGTIGSLTGAGIPEAEAHLYAEGARRGATLVAARVQDDDAAEALAILRRCGALDTNLRRAEYATGGWDGFVNQDIWDDDIGSEDISPPKSGRTRNVA